jgi:hypothetical protein
MKKILSYKMVVSWYLMQSSLHLGICGWKMMMMLLKARFYRLLVKLMKFKHFLCKKPRVRVRVQY